MLRMRRILVGLAVLAGCASSYAYRFDWTDPAPNGTFADGAIEATVALGSDGAIALDLANKTDDLVQVEWNKVAIDRGDGTVTTLRPNVDAGWIAPGARVQVQLVPFVLPHSGDAAARYEQRKLELVVPAIVKREPRTYRFHFTAHVKEL